MPLTLSAALQDHLDGELQTLASLWVIERRDGTIYRFTDHDRSITYQGAEYVTGVGYDRSAIEDKIDLSVDNMDVRGIIDGTYLDRDDIRGGLMDGARITIMIVNYKDLSQGHIVRRSGWIGTVKQNNLGQFDCELRGLSQALSEGLTLVYTPSCPVDLGSVKCKVAVLNKTEVARETRYERQEWVANPDYPALVYRCDTAGTTDAESEFVSSNYDVADGETVTDGSAVFTALGRFDKTFTVTRGGDRKSFEIELDDGEARLALFPDWFQDGALKFTTGANADIAKGVKVASEVSDGTLDVELHLRMPFNVEVGDTGTILPGCSKTITDCGNKFGNGLNFQGHPYIPGENYLKTYPNAK